MGNRSSSTSSSAEGDGPQSGMFLAKDLQAKINQDFDSHVIQHEWDKYRSLHLTRHDERQTSLALRQEEIKQQMGVLQSQAKQVHTQLNEVVDSAKSKLTDLEVEVGYDVKRLSTKFEGSLSESTPEGKCLDVRAELSHCYKTLKDSGECQIFAQKLEKCVTEALA